MTTTGKIKLLATSDAAASLRWSSLLELQVNAYFPYELSFFGSSETWRGARKILDAGCGNGFFLARLLKFFPNKTYTGLDISPELVKAAKFNHALGDAEIIQSDFFDYAPDGKFDVVIMRLIIQHMAGLTAIFEKLDALLKPSGSVVIIEPDTRTFSNYPATPKFMGLLAKYTEAASRNRLNRSNLSGLTDELSKLSGWKVSRDQTLIAPAVGPFSSSPLLQMFFLWIEVFERSGAVDFKFDDVRRELETWAENETSFNQVGVRIVEVMKT